MAHHGDVNLVLLNRQLSSASRSFLARFSCPAHNFSVLVRSHKLGFHPNVSQFLTEFQENQQKKMQMKVCLHPRPLCEYEELVHQDKQEVAPVLQSGAI